MKKLKTNRQAFLRKTSAILLAYVNLLVFVPMGHPVFALLMAVFIIAPAFSLTLRERMSFGGVAADGPVATLTDADIENVKKAAKEALFKEFGGLAEGKEMIGKLMDVLKQLQEKKTVEEVQSMKPEFEALKADILKIHGKLEKSNKKKGKINKDGSLQGVFNRGLQALKKSGAIDKFRRGDLSSLTITPGINVDGKLKMMHPKNGNLVDNPMSEATSVVPIGSGIPNILTQFEPGLTRVTRRKPFILQLIDLAQTVDRYISWMEQTNIDTGIAFNIAEGASAAGDYGSFRWTQNSQEAQEIVALSKMTLVILDDLQNAQQEVQTEILELLELRLDAQVFGGNGTGSNLKGILSYAQSFTNTGLAIQAPNNYDAIIAAILQIKVNGTKSGIAGGGEIINIFEPTDIVLNPVDFAQMDLTKDTLNRYVREYYPDYDGNMLLGGCRISENILVTQGYVLVMDARKSHARIRLDSSLTLGYVNTDFQDGLVTIKGCTRAVHYIKGIEVNAFVYDSFANIQAAIVKA